MMSIFKNFRALCVRPCAGTGWFLTGCAALFLLAGCTLPDEALKEAPLDVAGSEAYLLSPADVVKVTVYGEETLVDEFPIDQRGMLVMPMIGEIQAAGLTKTELQKKIKKRFVEAEYLSNPLVSVDVSHMRPFFIMGEVNNPGRYPYEPSLDVFKAIAMAGGYTPYAAKNRIVIDRGSGADKERLKAQENTPILPGDSIIVRERFF